MRILPVLGLAVCMLFGTSHPFAKAATNECDDVGTDPDQRIIACTAVISNEHLSKHDKAIGYSNRGDAWSDKGEYDKAIADYNQAIGLDPKYADAYVGRGTSWGSKGEHDHKKSVDYYDKAIADFTQAISIDPESYAAYDLRGVAWFGKRDSDKAIADFTKAISLDPKDEIAYGSRCGAWDNKGDSDKAIADCTKAVGLNPEDADAYTSLGSAWLQKVDYDKAIADFTKAISLDPKDDAARPYKDRGILEYYRVSPAAAQADFNQAVIATPTDAYDVLWLEIADRSTRAKSQLAANAARLDLSAWPGPIVKLFLGDASEADARNAAATGDKKTQQKQTCELNLYSAELAKLQGHDQDAMALYRQAQSGCPHTYIEWNAANLALRTKPHS